MSIIIAKVSYAQQTDTASTVKKLQEEKVILKTYHTEKSTENMFMPKTGLYDIPIPKEYYIHPFMAQKRIDAALADYYKEAKEKKSLLFRFINAIAPFINNQFEFAVYKIYDLPIVERGQPMLTPQLIEKQKKQ